MLSLDQFKRILGEAEFIYHAGGSGGEYACQQITEGNSLYVPAAVNTGIPEKFRNFWAENSNRFSYADLFLQRSLGKIGMESWNTDHRFTDIEEVYYYYQQELIKKDNNDILNRKYVIPKNKKILIAGGHQAFKGIENFVDDDRLTHIRFKTDKWRKYSRLMSFLKVQASPIYCDGNELIREYSKNYIYLTRSTMRHEYPDKWNEDCIPKDIFLSRLQTIVSSGHEIYSFFGMVHLQPWRFSKNLTWQDVVKIPPLELNTLEWLVNNSIEFQRLTRATNMDKVYTPDQYPYYEGYGKYYCMSEVLYEADFGNRFGVDIRSGMQVWHDYNRAMVKNMEDRLGYSFNFILNYV